MYDSAWANTGWLVFFIGFLTLYSPMFYLGMMGMPRRYYDYMKEFHSGNILSTIGSWILVTGFVIILINLIRSARNGAPAEMDPWHSKTLEWTVSSPPSLENFDELPVIAEDDGPYNYK
jgi:cytochrome c oxidase subunit 1